MEKFKRRKKIGGGLKFGLLLFAFSLLFFYLHRSDSDLDNNELTDENGEWLTERAGMLVGSDLASGELNLKEIRNQGDESAEEENKDGNPEVEEENIGSEDEAGEERLEIEGARDDGGVDKEEENLRLEKNIVMRRAPRFSGPSCKNFTLSLYRPKTFNLTALASYPGSGNTWLRHLIEYSTGIYTGSMYCDFDLFGKGFLGEIQPWDSGSTIVQKLHYQYTDELPFKRGILLLREPYKATVSFAQYLEGGHTGRASIEVFRDKGWPSFVVGQAYKWTSMAKSWMEAGIPLHVVHYEHLMQDAKKELEKICAFLHLQCEHLSTECFKNNTDGQFHRRGTQKLFVPFSPLVRKTVDKSIDFISNLLLKHGHEPIPVSLYQYYKLTSDKAATDTGDGSARSADS